MDESSLNFESLVAEHLATDRSPRARVRRLVDWILADPARVPDVERLAERVAMSPRTLSRHFRRETGLSPARFVAQARFELARRLLTHGLRVESAAQRAGFASAGCMRRAFRRTLNAAPRACASLGLRDDA